MIHWPQYPRDVPLNLFVDQDENPDMLADRIRQAVSLVEKEKASCALWFEGTPVLPGDHLIAFIKHDRKGKDCSIWVHIKPRAKNLIALPWHQEEAAA
jgi:hypothetical protein